ncbi:MAG: hypothetical protein AAGA56_22785 [Myxococcota bacterium]
MTTRLGLGLGLCLLLLVPAACSDEIDAAADCLAICDKYSECVDDIDTTACAEQCEAEADASDTYMAGVDRCDDCIDSGACMDLESCWSDCPPVAAP